MIEIHTPLLETRMKHFQDLRVIKLTWRLHPSDVLLSQSETTNRTGGMRGAGKRDRPFEKLRVVLALSCIIEPQTL